MDACCQGGLHRELVNRSKVQLQADRERVVIELVREAVDNINGDNLRSAFRAIKRLLSMPEPTGCEYAS